MSDLAKFSHQWGLEQETPPRVPVFQAAFLVTKQHSWLGKCEHLITQEDTFSAAKLWARQWRKEGYSDATGLWEKKYIYGVGKRRFSVVCMENNTIINK